MSQDSTPGPLDSLVPKALNESSHDNPELHFIGSALLRPSRVSDVVPGQNGNVGVLPAAAREDHVHGMAEGGAEVPPLNMDNTVGGTLDVQYGGTGQSTLAANQYLKGNGTAPVISQATPIPVPDGGTGQTFHNGGYFLKGNGAGPITSQAKINLSDINAIATPFTPVVTNVNVGVGGSITAYYETLSQYAVLFQAVITLGTSGFSVTGLPRISIPEGRTALLSTVLCSGTFRDVSAGVSIPIVGEVVTIGSAVDLYCEQVSGSNVVRTNTSATVPFTWAAGDFIRVSILTFAV